MQARLRLIPLTLGILLHAEHALADEEPKAPEAKSTEEAKKPDEQAKPDANEKTDAKPEETTKQPEPLEVSVIGQRDDALQKIPGGGTLVGAKEIRRAQPMDTGEILKRVPGLHVRPEEGAGLRLNVGLRGLDPTRSRQVLVLEDGVPVAINPYGEPDLYYGTPIDRVRAVEVVKGSGSILFGPQTNGGVINFLTITPPDKPTWALEVQNGSRDYLRFLANYGAAIGDVRYVAQIMHKRGNGIREMGFDATDFLGKIAFPTGEHGEAMVKLAIYDEFSKSTYVGLTRSMFDEDPKRSTIAPYDGFTVRRYDASLTQEQRFGASTKLRTIVYGYITDRVWRRQNYDRSEVQGVAYQRIVGDTKTPGGAVYFRDTTTTRDRQYEAAGIEPKLEHRFLTGNVRHTLTLGVRGHVETAVRKQYLAAFATSNAGELQSDEYHRSFALAGYVQDRLAFRNDLMVTPGVRMESVLSRRHIRRAEQGGAYRDVWIRGDSSSVAFMPGIGIVYGSPKLSAFGGVHVGYAPPRITTAISSSGTDQKLEAEQSTNFELGFRSAKPKWLRAEVTGFLMNFRNQIVSGSLASGQQSELVNGGQTLHRGIETAAMISLGKALGMPLDVDVSGRYTFSVATFRGGTFDGNTLPYAPRHTGSIVLDVEHKIGLSGQLAANYTSEQFADEANTVAVDPTGRLGLIPAYTTMDAALRFRIKNTGVTLSVVGKNLFGDVFVATRLPDGIHTAGFQQFNAGLRWDH